MGRCYEFGAEIHAGCEMAMVVSGEGGSCECTACGAGCPGRFAGCAAVVAVPGRVPPSAPAWSKPGAQWGGLHAESAPGRSPAAVARRPAWPRPAPQPADAADAIPPSLAANELRSVGGGTDLEKVQASLAEVREILLSQARSDRATNNPADPSGAVVEAIEALTEKLLDRDERLAKAFFAFSDRQADLGAQVDRLAAALARLAKGTTVPSSLRQLLARKP